MIIIMRSTTCGGKDTFIKQNFGDGHRNHVLSSDDFREMLFADKAEQRKNKMVFETIRMVLEQRLQARASVTILNSTHLRFKDISEVNELAKKYHSKIMVISIQPPTLDELKKRNSKRCNETGFCVPEGVIEKHYNRYYASMEPFIAESLYNDRFTFCEIDQEYNVIRIVENNKDEV